MSAQPQLQRIKIPDLVIRSADGKTETIPLTIERLSLGRSNVNDRAYPEDVGLSREHMVVERAGEDWVVRDLGSKNGTLVNGSRLTAPWKLKPGDRVAAGHLLLTFSPLLEEEASSEVVFYEGGDEAADLTSETPSSSTVITNLKELLAQERAATKDTTGGALEMVTRMKALIRAGRELAGHRPLEDLFAVILDLSLEAVSANRGVLMTLEGEQLIVRAARGEGFRISTAVRDHVIEAKSSLLVRDAQQDRAFRERLSIQEHKVRSMIAVPLQTSDKVMGLIYLDSPSFNREFSREDLNLLTVMANVAAIRIDHARLVEVEHAERIHKRDLEQAADIQNRLLPSAAPAVGGTDLAGYNVPCRTVGGDYYDFFTYPDGRVALVVADVSGKGMPASLMMSSLQARVQVLAEDPTNLATLVTRLNNLVRKNCPSNRFITFFMCVLNPSTGELTFSNAGHNPPLLVRTDGSVEMLEGGGPPLAILSGFQFEQVTIQMNRGDLLVMFSDGVTEAANAEGEEFGEDRLGAILQRRQGDGAQSILNHLNGVLTEWTGNLGFADDLTLVVARRV